MALLPKNRTKISTPPAQDTAWNPFTGRPQDADPDRERQLADGQRALSTLRTPEHRRAAIDAARDENGVHPDAIGMGPLPLEQRVARALRGN